MGLWINNEGDNSQFGEGYWKGLRGAQSRETLCYTGNLNALAKEVFYVTGYKYGLI
jgi:hypothetical protein